ncbi:STAS domain-containing protein [Streptomyces sp. NPDC060011]|uniref:STAS domain-containing protein n=1 Tax=Streptomyces sp. NPDC060011 TaxID=3347037 RepID=UPI0036ABB7F1
MRIVIFSRSNGRPTVFLEGEIDSDTAPAVHDALAACHDRTTTGVDVDLGAVSFCDASGLNLFLDVANRSAEWAGDMRLHRPSRAVLRLLKITGTGFLLADDVTSALPSPDSGPPASDAP